MDNLIADVLGDVALMLILSALFGALARRLGQPAVIGQIAAGILLGPTLLGHLPGHLMTRLFPSAALSYLNVLAQVAVVIFMFTVGYELSWPSRRGQGRLPLLIAPAALLVPLLVGLGLAVVDRSGFAALGQPHITATFALFIGVALSITALPVLAVIVRERGLADTLPGRTATAAAGLMDAAAWLILAATLAGAAGRPGRSWPATLGLFAVFVVVMLALVRPALRWWLSRRRAVFTGLLPLAIVLALGSAWVSTSLGVHPVFGGFIAGLTMPRVDGAPDADVLSRAEELGGLLLPLFFLVTGLSTNVGGLTGGSLVMLAIVGAIAAAGKLGPGYATARLGGLRSREAATVAVLINTRGLTELIALNAGLQAHIIGARLFSILVLMALVMTAATAPLLSAVRAPAARPAAVDAAPSPHP